MNKLRLREVKWLTLGHRANRQHSQPSHTWILCSPIYTIISEGGPRVIYFWGKVNKLPESSLPLKSTSSLLLNASSCVLVSWHCQMSDFQMLFLCTFSNILSKILWTLQQHFINIGSTHLKWDKFRAVLKFTSAL